VKRLANEWGTQEESKALTEQLRKLVRDSWNNRNIESQEDWISFIKKDTNVIKSLKAIMKSFEAKEASEYEKALTRLVFYLFVAEGGFTNYMNLLCFLLTLQGHDLYNYFNREFACSIDEIAKVESRTKELFLEKHGFGLFNKGWDRNMRNSIAHYDFEIEDDGTTKIDGTPTDVKKKVRQILSFLAQVSDNLIGEIRECRKSTPQRQLE
jgi:hypothetical protein